MASLTVIVFLVRRVRDVFYQCSLRRHGRVNGQFKFRAIQFHQAYVYRDFRRLLLSYLFVISRMSDVAFTLPRLTKSIRSKGFSHLVKVVRENKFQRAFSSMDYVRAANGATHRFRVLFLIFPCQCFRHLVGGSVNDRRDQMNRRANTCTVFVTFIRGFLFRVPFHNISAISIRLLTYLVLREDDARRLTSPYVRVRVRVRFKGFTRVTLGVSNHFFQVSTADRVFNRSHLCAIASVVEVQVYDRQIPIYGGRGTVVLVLRLRGSFCYSRMVPRVRVAH